ncbi:5'-methylthioadenosine/adenosylhomocysteine nucleosidase [Flavobacterium sp. NRK1]|uniref:5'-methylthioadenosine/adenosylhomocysteine nucleosidase n=1 Tax=Flavobacterium sp. NRK1 TaxID=2954929 RepID=UPI00209268A3|nr:5'-methylthioadenosine/adenosylhomocysteine nucleosidase [Flavobacterium sp. NRK1]MCO6148863.1 5'-methylthioadenosine/adenosylhomocysteine nucleosidase [Flavobacterium sp. NRK1]
MTNKIIGIMGAMPQEIEGVTALLENPVRKIIGMRTYTTGTINGINAVVVFSRWGKVAASATVVTLIHVFNITDLIFTGVAGAIDPTLNIGDIVIAKRLYQHDMDARPLMQQFEIPLLGKTFFECDTDELEKVKNTISPLVVNNMLKNNIDAAILAEFNITTPNLHIGDIASGDQFFATNEQKLNLHNKLPTILCVEMEGAAVAQVCFEHKIPFIIIRTISDTADEQSHVDFPKFIEKVSSKYSVCIIEHLLS